MVRDIEALTERLRTECGCVGHYPSYQDSMRLPDCFGGRVKVVEEITPVPFVVAGAARARIVLPRGLGERERENALLEEVGHLFLDRDAAGIGRQNLGQLAGASDARCERYAGLFALLWRLPRQMVERATDAEVMAESGCSREEVMRRRELL